MIFQSPDHTLLILSFIAYLISTISYFHYLFYQKESLQRTAFGFFLGGACLHLISVGIGTALLGTLPAHNLSQTLSIAGLALAVTYILLKFQYNLKILGIFTAPLTACMVLTATIIPQAPPAKAVFLKGFWLISHIVLIFTGEAALALACGAGILYLIQEKTIKGKKRGFFFKRLPPLDFLDSTSYSCLVTGFAMLTFGFISGIVYAESVWGRFWSWDPKEVWSAVTWLIYAALLHGRLTAGWQGRRSAIMTIIGFAVLLFTFFGVNLFIGGHHQAFTK